MRWLVVLDPLEGLVSETDTSLAIIARARTDGITVDTAAIEDLFFETHAAVAAVDAAGRRQTRALNTYSLILMRKEPPYDLAFHYATQLLSLSGTLVVNSPSALRDFNEKLIALPFVASMPPTLVSSDPAAILRFAARIGPCVIKALDSFQGKSVQRLEATDETLVATYTAAGSRPVMVQKFLEKVQAGDKRVILLGDRPLGAALRRPRQGFHANFANSDALPTELTGKERRLIDEAGPWLLARGIHFAGLDFIDEQLTEINITCPTGVVQISALEGRQLTGEIVAYLLRLAG